VTEKTQKSCNFGVKSDLGGKQKSAKEKKIILDQKKSQFFRPCFNIFLHFLAKF